MFCPKCTEKIGMHLYKCMTTIDVAQGMTCCVCGYWVDKGPGSVRSKSSKRARKR